MQFGTLMSDVAGVLATGEVSTPSTTIDWADMITKSISSVTTELTTVISTGVPLIIGLVATVSIAKFVIKWVKGNINRAG